MAKMTQDASDVYYGKTSVFTINRVKPEYRKSSNNALVVVWGLVYVCILDWMIEEPQNPVSEKPKVSKS